MVWFADLSPCTYFGEECASFLRAVGWLERAKPFPSGPVESEVFGRLVELLKNPWQPGMFMGFHRCDLCLYEGNATSVRNLFIPGGSVVFVCPELVVHYMNAHWYRPPDEFCRAVLACPAMRSVPYLKALLASGARPLVHPILAAEPPNNFPTQEKSFPPVQP
jgi:hypothetical protein